jgi:hypothetical protein
MRQLKSFITGGQIMKEASIKKEIYISVIASVLVMIFIEPILKFFWNWIILTSTGMFKGLLDSFYRGAALGHRNQIDVQFFFFITAAVLGIMVSILILKTTYQAQIKSSIDKIPKKLSSVIKILYAIALIISIMFALITNFVDLQLNASFQQRLTVLSPKITDQEYKEFQSLWASMKDREDFLTIVNNMDSVAENKNIELPPLLLK